MIKVIVQVFVFLVLLFFPNPRRLLVGGIEVRFSRAFRAHGNQRDQLREIVRVASRAFRRRRGRPNQIVKTVTALPALVFVDWHERSL